MAKSPAPTRDDKLDTAIVVTIGPKLAAKAEAVALSREETLGETINALVRIAIRDDMINAVIDDGRGA